MHETSNTENEVSFSVFECVYVKILFAFSVLRPSFSIFAVAISIFAVAISIFAIAISINEVAISINEVSFFGFVNGVLVWAIAMRARQWSIVVKL